MGFFKHILWLAPALIIIFYYVAMKQNKHEAELKKEFTEFDRDFAMSKSNNSNNEYWLDTVSKKSNELNQKQNEKDLSNSKAKIVLKKIEEAAKENGIVDMDKELEK